MESTDATPPLAADDGGGLLQFLLGLEDPLPEDELGREAREWFERSWSDARAGILARSTRLRLTPRSPEAPRLFRFELDRPYRRRNADGAIELAPGPIRGTIHYRADLLNALPDEAGVVVLVDTDLSFYHCNHDARSGLLCLGDLRGPCPLERLLPHLYSILSYENHSTTSPLDPHAAAYFATDPEAFLGLRPVEPLWGS